MLAMIIDVTVACVSKVREIVEILISDKFNDEFLEEMGGPL